MIRTIELTQFRNIEHISLSFNTHITTLYGPNGIGKTNLLESIFYCSTTKSFRTKDNHLIKYGNDFFKIQSTYDDTKNVEIRYEQLPQKKKTILLNGRKVTSPKVIGTHPVVLFAPSDLNLLTATSSVRRKLLDGILTQSDKFYLRHLLTYKKLIRQRNALLRSYKMQTITRNQLTEQLFVWDLLLEEPANYISSARKKLIEGFTPIIQESYELLSHKTDKVTLQYVESVPSELVKALHDNLRVDLAAGHTTIGPHRDDLAIYFDNHPIVQIASRGESRTTILALKVAELFFIHSVANIRPILLLDDVFSELDEQRQNNLLTQLTDTQTIITTTHLDDKMKHTTTPIAVEEILHES